ncbi:MAG: hypothetical protein J5980_04085 [Muribaculaceae bacterium]|nr:hypothetical protein [Muribaculaceae bacterium]
MKKLLCLLYVALIISSCSTSEDDLTVYDDVLSNTRWTQNYVKSQTGVINEKIEIPEYIRNRLDVVELPSVERIDTIWDVDNSEGKYILTFGNNDCKLDDVHYSKGSYRIHKFVRKETYYPDQTHSWTDDSSKRMYEIVIRNDTLYFKETYIGEDKNELLRNEWMYANHQFDDTTLSLSASFPYANEKIITYNMTFTRNGRNIELSGDKHFVGILNEDRDRIQFNELGTLYLE